MRNSEECPKELGLYDFCSIIPTGLYTYEEGIYTIHFFFNGVTYRHQIELEHCVEIVLPPRLLNEETVVHFNIIRPNGTPYVEKDKDGIIGLHTMFRIDITQIHNLPIL